MSEYSELKFYDLVKEAEGSLGKPIREFTRKEYLDLLFDKVGVSISSYTALKKTIITMSDNDETVISTVNSIKYANVAHKDAYGSSYFKSYHDMMKVAREAAQKTSIERDCDVRIFDVTLATVTLAWYGVKINDCVTIRKRDVLSTSELVLPTGGTVALCKEAYVFLTDYINAEGYFSFRGMERWMPYQPSAFILRTGKSMQCSVQTIRTGISRYLQSEEKKITYDSVYWSGVFSRIHDYEKRHGRIYVPNPLNQEDRAEFMSLMSTLIGDRVNGDYDIYAKFKLYKAYRKFFYNE